METKKIKFVGYYPGFEPVLSRAYNILTRYYNVEICDDPDYVFCSCFGRPYEYIKYDGIRIFYSAENYAPNFNTVDYFIGFNHLSAQDRYFRYPVSLYTPLVAKASEKHVNLDMEQLLSRPHFCNFIYGNAKGQAARAELFKQLSNYKRVESAGTYLNNQVDGWYAKNESEKMAFLNTCKFTIAVDSVQLSGFSTEKITHAFAANTIPIYLGDPDIEEIFNENAFVNGNIYGSVEEVVQRVIEIDQNDELYFSMLREPAFKRESAVQELEQAYEEFILRIFSQKKEAAYRRSRNFFGVYDDTNMNLVNAVAGSKLLQLGVALYRRMSR